VHDRVFVAIPGSSRLKWWSTLPIWPFASRVLAYIAAEAVIVIQILGVIAIVALLVFFVMHRKQNAAKSSH
jgi:hypothetical protein